MGDLQIHYATNFEYEPSFIRSSLPLWTFGFGILVDARLRWLCMYVTQDLRLGPYCPAPVFIFFKSVQ